MVAELSILSRVFDFMSRMPTAEEIVALKTTEEEEARWDYLDYRRNIGQITEEEQEELKENLLAQHLMVIAKANAMGQLKKIAN